MPKSKKGNKNQVQPDPVPSLSSGVLPGYSARYMIDGKKPNATGASYSNDPNTAQYGKASFPPVPPNHSGLSQYNASGPTQNGNPTGVNYAKGITGNVIFDSSGSGGSKSPPMKSDNNFASGPSGRGFSSSDSTSSNSGEGEMVNNWGNYLWSTLFG